MKIDSIFTAALNKWTIKLKDITYIIGGKIDNKSFILVDKVVNDDPSISDDKLYHSISNKDIYISLTGDGELMDFIKEYDSVVSKLVINKTFIETIVNNFLNNYSGNISKKISLYIIENGNFKRIDINFDKNKYIDFKTIEFHNNEFIVCNSNTKEIIEIVPENIKNFSEFYIKKLFNCVNAKYSTEEYFIDGFDHIEKSCLEI